MELRKDTCPVCRTDISPAVPGVCLRLRDEIVAKFPEQIAARRAEVAEEEAKAAREKQERAAPGPAAAQRRPPQAVPVPAAPGGGGGSGGGAQSRRQAQGQHPPATPAQATSAGPSWEFGRGPRPTAQQPSTGGTAAWAASPAGSQQGE